MLQKLVLGVSYTHAPLVKPVVTHITLDTCLVGLDRATANATWRLHWTWIHFNIARKQQQPVTEGWNQCRMLTLPGLDVSAQSESTCNSDRAATQWQESTRHAKNISVITLDFFIVNRWICEVINRQQTQQQKLATDSHFDIWIHFNIARKQQQPITEGWNQCRMLTLF